MKEASNENTGILQGRRAGLVLDRALEFVGWTRSAELSCNALKDPNYGQNADPGQSRDRNSRLHQKKTPVVQALSLPGLKLIPG